MPNVSVFMGPLSSMTKNGHTFLWKPLHQKCFEEIKALVCRTPILCPIYQKNPDPIWVVCDTSTFGVGAMYRQGSDWTNCHPAGFMSRKFKEAQFNYQVFKMDVKNRILYTEGSPVELRYEQNLASTYKKLHPSPRHWFQFQEDDKQQELQGV